jgi:hypothetical protein
MLDTIVAIYSRCIRSASPRTLKGFSELPTDGYIADLAGWDVFQLIERAPLLLVYEVKLPY